MIKRRLQTAQTAQTAQTVQTTLCSLKNFDCYSLRDTDESTHDLSRNRLRLLKQLSILSELCFFYEVDEVCCVFEI